MTIGNFDGTKFAEEMVGKLGSQSALEGSVHALGIIIGTMEFNYSDSERCLGAAALLHMEATALVRAAAGRKVKVDDRHRRWTAAAILLRDAADLIDKVTL